MVMTNSQFNYLTKGLITDVFNGLYEKNEPEWKKVFRSVTGQRSNVHRDVMVYGFDVAREKTPGAVIASDDGGEELSFEYLYKTYALQAGLTRELEEDNRYIEMLRIYSDHITRSLMETQELSCADFLNRGFDSAYPIGDGQALFSANHPQYSGVQSNVLTPATLSQTSLEAATTQVWGTRDFRGKIIGLRSEALICSKDNYLQGKVLMENTLRAGTTNNDVSPLRYISDFSEGVVKMTRLTSTSVSSQWHVKTNAPHGLQMVWHPKGGQPKLADEGSFEADTLKIKGRMRYAVGITNYRGIFGNAGV